ncbi:MAG: endolytic transglycosylase MltG [Chloroflexi bacterium]|nr:endolytic transglycosylase MltG [Chloroflexota bacterium]
MEKRKSFRAKVDAEHKPRYSPIRFLIFVLAIAVCGGAGYFAFTSLLSVEGGEIPGIDLTRITSFDQLAVDIYLRVRQSDVEWRSPGTGDVAFAVQAGDNPATIGTRLQKLGLVQDVDLFRQVAKARAVEKSLEVGDYTLQRGMSMDEILVALQHGVTRPNTIVITEGRRVEEVAQLLERQSVVKAADFVAAAKAGTFGIPALKDRPSGSSLEGFLFPDTYQIPRDATAAQLVGIMLANFDRKVPADVWSKSSDLKLSPYQLLIVASIVEREAVKADERPVIASVYLNRVKKGMRLEADPTVQYAMGYQPDKGTWWKTPVQLEEYSKVTGPYNTYLRDGLPPTPICSPGLGAIRAAFEPAKTEYLFFLARGDGSHVFARTFEEHQANIAKYQR